MDEYFGTAAQIAQQRRLHALQAAAVCDGLVIQGRQTLLFHAERTGPHKVMHLLHLYGAVGLIGQASALTCEIETLLRGGCEIAGGRLVVAGQPNVFQACQAAVTAREAAGLLPTVTRVTASSPQKMVTAIQRGLADAGLAPLPGYFLRGQSASPALTLAAVDRDGQVLGSSTVQDISAGGVSRTLFSCGLWIDPTQRNARLGTWLYASSVLAAQAVFRARTLLSTVIASNTPVLGMLARCAILPDNTLTFLGLTAAAQEASAMQRAPLLQAFAEG